MRLTRDLLLGTSATGAMIAAGVPAAERDPYAELAETLQHGRVVSDKVRAIGKSPVLGVGYTGERL